MIEGDRLPLSITFCQSLKRGSVLKVIMRTHLKKMNQSLNAFHSWSTCKQISSPVVLWYLLLRNDDGIRLINCMLNIKQYQLVYNKNKTKKHAISNSKLRKTLIKKRIKTNCGNIIWCNFFLYSRAKGLYSYLQSDIYCRKGKIRLK